jgi:hypothetical protein
MVTTMRSDETVRVISFRRAHKGERQQFQKLTGYEKSCSNPVDSPEADSSSI